MVRDVYPIGGSGSDEDTGMSLGLGLYWAAAGLGCLLGCQFANMLPNQTRPVLTKAMTVGFFFAACGYSLCKPRLELSRQHAANLLNRCVVPSSLGVLQLRCRDVGRRCESCGKCQCVAMTLYMRSPLCMS